MGADGHIDIARATKVEEALLPEELDLLKHIPGVYKDLLDGYEYYHIYYDYSSYEYPFELDTWKYHLGENPLITETLMKRLRILFSTSWEVWT